MLWIVSAIVAVIVVSGVTFTHQPRFGRMPRGERLERIKLSPNYRDGQFQNLHETPMMTSGKGRVRSMLNFLFRKAEGLRPEVGLPVVKTDLHR